jgi:ribonuclease D
VEWKFDRRNPGKEYFTLQENISLIQVASESEVGLFHIGLHKGKTVAEVLAPSLRKIIEAEYITKTGVAILNADGSRLKKYMNLRPKGLFELSHLYRLVKYSTTDPAQCTKSIVSLTKQVEEHLGFPLHKGDVRTSDWSKALNQDQIRYAASDAYCGFVLYRIMDAKRLKLVPTPPRPEHAEKWAPIRLAEPVVSDEETEASESAELAPLPGKATETTSSKTTKSIISKKPASEVDNLDTLGKSVFDALCENRAEIATRDGLKPYIIATNTVLANVAKARPKTLEDLAKVKGVGPLKLKNYGEGWLKVISTHVGHLDPALSITPRNDSFLSTSEELAVPTTKRKRPQFRVPPPLPDTSHLTTPEDPSSNLQINRQATLQRSVSAPQPLSSLSAFKPLPPSLNHSRSSDLSPEVDPSFRRLYSALSALRIRLSGITGKAVHDVSSDETLKALATRRPTTIGEICRIPFAGKLLQTCRSNDIDLLAFLQSQYSSESFGLNAQISPAPTMVAGVSSTEQLSAMLQDTFPTVQNPSSSVGASNMNISPGPRVAMIPPVNRSPLSVISETRSSQATSTSSFSEPQISNKGQLVERPSIVPADEGLVSYSDEDIDWEEISARL